MEYFRKISKKEHTCVYQTFLSLLSLFQIYQVYRYLHSSEYILFQETPLKYCLLVRQYSYHLLIQIESSYQESGRYSRGFGRKAVGHPESMHGHKQDIYQEFLSIYL